VSGWIVGFGQSDTWHNTVVHVLSSADAPTVADAYPITDQ
jgi:hypothetical protein